MLASALSGLGRHLAETGELGEARQVLEEAIEITRARGLLSLRVQALANLGRLERADRPEAAAGHFQEALSLAGEADSAREVLSALEGLAEILLDRDPPFAARLLAAAEANREVLGTVRPTNEQPAFDAAVATARALIGAEAFATAWAEGSALRVSEAIEFALGARGPGSEPRQ